jgi:V/A-type H+/Na+-transporting ATPase subunit I
MNLEMAPIEIIGLKADLQPVIHTLRTLGCVHIDEITSSPQVSARPLSLDRETLGRQEELSFLLARVNGVLEILGGAQAVHSTPPAEIDLAEIRSSLAVLSPQVKSLTGRHEELQSKLSLLPRYEATLRKLLPIIPPSAHDPGCFSIGVLVSRVNLGVLDSIGKRILDLTGGRAEVVGSDIDASTRAMFAVFPREFTEEIEALLGQEDVARLRLPEELSTGPPDVALQVLQRQMIAIPESIRAIDRELAGLAVEWRDRLVVWRDALLDEIEANSVLARFGETDTTFVIAGWVPAGKFEKIKNGLDKVIGESVLVRQLPMTAAMKKSAPVVLQNPAPARPFESLVNLLALPRYGHTDPTRLMALFLPVFFGMILGDIGYGCILLAASLLLRRKQKPGVFRDILTILAMGSAWAILFGFLFGELFGNLGEAIGLHPLWFDRASQEHVAGLLAMTIAIGAVHVTLGLIIGVWEGIKDRSRSHLLERGGMLLGLAGLFLITGVLADVLPDSLMTPAIAGLITGIVLLGASLGWLGILMGPIEFIGLIGNILSYLRIAAIGLASVYLAKVANDVAGIIGNLFVGVILAVLIHSLNLVLGAFSPTIHSLRLHYVEFFRKFYEGGGRPYQPYQSHLVKRAP